MKIVDIADEIYRELEANDISIPSVAFWLKTNIGTLNNLIVTSYIIDPNGEIVDPTGIDPTAVNALGDPIQVEEANIYKQMYGVYWLGKQIRKHLFASGTQAVISIDSDGASVKRINKTTIAAEFRQLLKDENQRLKEMINAYKSRKNVPLHVVGTDTIPQWMFPNPWKTFPRVHF